MSYQLDPREGELQYPQDPIYNFYLDRLPSGEAQYKFAPGTSEISPRKNLIVGCQYDFKLTYCPGTCKLPNGTIVSFSIPRTWTQPQILSKGPGFAEGKDSNGRQLKISLTQNIHLQWWVKVHLESELCENESITVSLHKITIQRFPQKEFSDWRNAMRTVIDRCGNAEYACVPASHSKKPTIISAPPSRFNVVTPAIIHSRQPTPVRVATLDYCDNKAYPAPTGEVFVANPTDPFTPLSVIEMTNQDNGHLSFTTPPPSGQKISRIIVSNKKDNLGGSNCPAIVSDNIEDNVFFGDIHAKTKLSDGLNSPAEFFEHARDVALLDFAAIADHNDAETSNIEDHFGTQMPDTDFLQIQKYAKNSTLLRDLSPCKDLSKIISMDTQDIVTFTSVIFAQAYSVAGLLWNYTNTFKGMMHLLSRTIRSFGIHVYT